MGERVANLSSLRRNCLAFGGPLSDVPFSVLKLFALLMKTRRISGVEFKERGSWLFFFSYPSFCWFKILLDLFYTFVWGRSYDVKIIMVEFLSGEVIEIYL